MLCNVMSRLKLRMSVGNGLGIPPRLLEGPRELSNLR